MWIRSGVIRDWRGALGAFVATWFNIPSALLSAVTAAFVMSIAGLVVNTFGVENQIIPGPVRDAPIVGSLAEGLLSQSGGILVTVAAFVIGLLGGFLVVIILPWAGMLDDPIKLAGSLLGVLVSAFVLGVLYTLFRVLCEPWLLRVSGARVPSRRENEFLLPILRGCADRLDLPNLPTLLVDDRFDVNAHAYTRHVVVSKGLMEEPEEHIAAVLSHELVHWHNGDEVTSAFVRGIALPLVVLHAVPTWLMRTFPHPATKFVVFLFAWPVLVTMRYLVMPLQRLDTRRAEYRADQGAVIAGHLHAMRSILSSRKSFEMGRTGWEEAVCATHPPAELRLERLEAPSQSYPLRGTEPAVATDRTVDSTMLADRSAVLPPPGSMGSPQGWLIAGALVLVGCGVLGLLTVVQATFFRPGQAVESYFDALADHDGEDARDWLGEASRTALGDDSLPVKLVESDDYQPPLDVKVLESESDGDSATVVVEYTLAGSVIKDVLQLHRDESSTLGVFKGWSLANGLSGLNLGEQVPGLEVNGVPVGARQEESGAGDTGPSVIPVFPGVYKVTAEGNPLTTTPDEMVIVRLAGPGSFVDLKPAVSPAALEETTRLVREHLDGCAAQKVPNPKGCPLDFPGYYAPDQATWRIVTYPVVKMTLTGATTAQVDTAYGTAEVSWTELGFSSSTNQKQDVSFAIAGTVSASPNGLLYTPRA